MCIFFCNFESYSDSLEKNPMRKILYFIIFLFLCSIELRAQSVLTGNSPSYAGTELIFKTQNDPFAESDSILAKCIVAANGDFTVTIQVKEITNVFADLGIYRGFLYVEPDVHYVISFPDKTDKTPAEKLNPFFEATHFQFSIKNLKNTDLNFLMLAFDDAYLPYFSKFAKDRYMKNTRALVDSAIFDLRKIEKYSSNAYFQTFVNYKIGFLKHLAYQQKSKSISKEYFQNKPVLYNNPAYTDLLNQVYSKYFYFFGRTPAGKPIFDDINTYKSYSKLLKTLKNDSVLKNDTLRELIILKNIHDEFYSSNFSRSGLINILDTFINTTQLPVHKRYAIIIKNKITRLMPGFEPPPFSLLDKDSVLIHLADYKGKYVYLNFCVCNSYACIKEFDILKRLLDKYKNQFVIITIASDDNRESMATFTKKSDYNWKFLHYGNQPEILEKYDIRAFPTYFLIGPDGKLIFSPAVSPAENFEQFLFQAMRSRGDI